MKTTSFRVLALFFLLIIAAACGNNSISTQPAIPPESTRILPIGVFVKPKQHGKLILCDLQGKEVKTYTFPGITNLEPGEVIVAGGVKDQPANVPIIYLEHNPQPGLKVNHNDVISPLVNMENIFQLAGAASQPVMSYSRVQTQTNGYSYELFLGSIDQIANTKPLISHFDAKYLFVYHPLSVDASNGVIKGVWFTRTPWGVGGMGFLRNKGLDYFDVSSGQEVPILSVDQNLQGFSEDHIMAAVMDESNQQHPVIKFINLKTGKSIQFPTNPLNDQGGGDVKFSPGNHYAAWLEAGGTLMSDTPDYHSQLRIARLIEQPALEIDLTDHSIAEQLKLPDTSFIAPAGWLADQVLLVNVQGNLYKLSVPEKKFTPYCQGSFVSFAYP